MKRLLMALVVASALTRVQAQTPPIEPNTAVNAASQLLQLIDAGRVDEAWQGASPAAKQLVPRDRFVTDVTAARAARGNAISRQWAGVTRRDSPGSATLPAGSYLNVEFETRFSNGAAATELVSFRLDDDKRWRLSGYVLR